MSDSYGHYEFPNVSEGAYVLSAAKRNYLPAHWGQNAWNLPGAPIYLGDAGLFVAEMKLKRLGVITGEVWDESHLGIPGVRVYAYRAGKTLRPVASGESDDRGVYRIYGLTPGKYYVRTAPKELEGEYAVLPTFFGQTTRRDAAIISSVRLEQDTSLVTIEPFAGRLSTIQVNTPAVQSLVTISLQTDFGVKIARVPGGTPATFSELAPGMYDATAEAVSGGVPLSGYLRFNVDHRNQSVTMGLNPLPVIPVTCKTAESVLPPGSVSVTAVRVVPDDGTKVALGCSVANRLPFGIYEVKSTVPAGMYLDFVAAPLFRKDKPYTLDLMRGYSTHADIVFSSNPATIRGIVRANGKQPAIGVPVILKALDDEIQAKLRSAPYTFTGSDGRFEFKLVPPGQYEVLASMQLAPPEDADWDFPSGKSVLAEAGKTADIDIELIEIPGVQ